ncbi:FlgB family protein [Lutimaribacter sp. EGI FJ00015]|uniref:FlgB family protein n=1 Tax=Lutimaribacter degradans TaxID=2945989 RepID=A0ACC5ZWF9_9RHOB|nr:FlgB family protein [Lutimaribacter sp. EGI FJ00013]MCM2561894.1 FlgB family protein [Lutimaribacter sp. EGI FJ00013]MCO0613074.1 FlgB family protein [Lutimaribacter sp. EGI FJ00015]
MASHAGARQATIAQNMAHADTPGYKAHDLPPFADMVSDRQTVQKATRTRHLNGTVAGQMSFETVARDGAGTNPNGNNVTIEQEMLHAVDTKRQHDRALAIYKSSLTILRSAIGRR